MRDKKQMIIIGAVVLIIVVLVVVFMFVRKSSAENLEMSHSDNADEMGFDYGGNFNEFEYRDEETEESVEDENETLDLDKISSEMEKRREDFEKSKPGIVITEETEDGNENSLGKIQTLSDTELEENSNETAVEEKLEETDGADGGEEHQMTSGKEYAEHEVLCDAASQDEAEAIASQINGTVLSCQNGTARIQITETVDELLTRLEQEGSSLVLYRNYHISIQ